MSGKVKRVTPPEGLKLPEGMVYVGMGGKRIENSSYPYCGTKLGGLWTRGLAGFEEETHYCLPADSPLLEPLPRTVNLPAGLPPVPEDGLTVGGWGAGMEEGKHNGYFTAEIGDDEWCYYGPGKARTQGHKPERFILYRPPVAKPEPTTKTVPFDSVADFGPTFPVWVHYPAGGCAMIDAFGINEARALRDWKSYKARADLNQRWSTSPLTKWEDAKPFTKEVPA